MRDPGRFLRRFDWPVSEFDMPLCIAHRGASAKARENTLDAFALASAEGADMWELDTQMTRDGVVVVSHDDHLMRVFGVDRHISQLTADELDALDGVNVPRFADVAALARKLGAGLFIELKARGTGPRCWHELIAHDQRFAAFGSFDSVQIRELREFGCDWPLAILVGLGYDPVMLAEVSGADLVRLCWEKAGTHPQDLMTPALIDAIARSGREIVLWHEERESVLCDIMGLPVLGICTNAPALMARGPIRHASNE